MAEDLVFSELAGDQTDLEVALQVDSICDAFESSWRSGGAPELKDYLLATDLPLETLFVELVLIDISYRRRQGEQPTFGDYAARFPHFGELLDGLTMPVAELTPQGQQDRKVLEKGSPFGRFVLLEEAGQGTFGVVWKARDFELQRDVALKVFRECFSNVSRKLLTREALAVAQINHQNVVKVYEIGQVDGRDFVAFEYVSGGTLLEWVQNYAKERGTAQVEPQVAAELARQLAAGLQAVHTCGVVHRDFKPGNILIDEAGTLKISDFGLARHAELLATISGDGVLMGTLPYMSPEQFAAGDVSNRSDLYSLGGVLYELLTGERPLTGTRSEFVTKIAQELPRRPSQLANVPESLENICLRGLEKLPEDRYQTAAEMQADLEKYLQGEDVPAFKPSSLKRGQRFFRRYFITITSIACGLLGLAAFGSVALQVPDDGKRVVTLASDPPGAKVAFVPLNKTGVPQPDQIVHARGTTPIQVRLLPQDYLVEVYFDDGSGRFHEVYRKVPSESEQEGTTYDAFRNWEIVEGNPGSVNLPRVTIPDAAVTEGMVQVPGSERFLCGIENSTLEPAVVRSIPSFYMDTKEVSIRDYLTAISHAVGGPVTRAEGDARWQDPPTIDHAFTTKWHKAVWGAELLGKRLPDEFEFEIAATRNGTQRFSWGNKEDPEDLPEASFSPVGFPQFDRVDYERPIFGLGSNVAEWTMTHTMSDRSTAVMTDQTQLALRTIRGGTAEVVHGAPAVDGDLRDPRSRTSAFYTEIKPGLGFRCVRSLKPRLTPQDFIVTASE